MKIINKKAYFDYFVIEDVVAGLMLLSSEVKSVFNGDVNFGDSHIIFKDGEMFIKNMRIAQYKNTLDSQNHEEMRDKKLLLKKKEIAKISKSIEERGITIIPLEILTLNNKIKIKIGVCRGKKAFDKRESIKKRDIEREFQRKF